MKPDDLEITKLCAEAMGGMRVEHPNVSNEWLWCRRPPDKEMLLEEYKRNFPVFEYNPLHDDAQAMALVKEFMLVVRNTTSGWHVENIDDGIGDGVKDDDLNRAICKSVAKMQKGKR